MTYLSKAILCTLLLASSIHCHASNFSLESSEDSSDESAPTYQRVILSDEAEIKGYKFQMFGLLIGDIGICENAPKIEDDIGLVLSYVDDFLLNVKHVDPSKILVVFDVDGVLTKEAEPSPLTKNEARKDAVTTVRKLQELGVTTLASSAWHIPVQTYNRLIETGYQDLFKLYKEPEFETLPVLNHAKGFPVFKTGLMASVQKPRVDFPYFRQKAFAPHAVLGEQAAGFTHILFVEDSSSNVAFFHRDVLGPHKPYKEGTEFAYFLLSSIGKKSPRTE